MAKSKIMVRMNPLVVLLLLFILSSCQSEINHTYYQYYMGVMNIENPVLVEFKGSEQLYVCPDSTLKYCCDSNWIQRKDVYPYLLMVENTRQRPTLFNRFQLSKFHYFNRGYYPYYMYKELQNIIFYRFYYNIEVFEVYMQATEGYWYDIADPYFQNPYADSYDYFSYGKEYRLVVKPHYNLFQILKLQYKYKDHFRVP